MIHIVGDGQGGVKVFHQEVMVPAEHEHQHALAAADATDAMIGDDDLRPAGSNAAPPLTTEQAEG